MFELLDTETMGTATTLVLAGTVAALAVRYRRVSRGDPLSGLLSNPVPAVAARVEARGAVLWSGYRSSDGRVAA